MKTILIVFLIFCCCDITFGTTEQPDMGPCYCAAFDKIELSYRDQPLINQHPMNVSCDENGLATCTKMCIALAEAAKVRGPSILCSAIGYVMHLKASAFVRICSNQMWDFTGLTSTEPLCCNAGKPISCDSESDNY